jgi:hypothetical protein
VFLQAQKKDRCQVIPHDGLDALPDFFGFHVRPLTASMVAEKEMVYTLDGRHVKEKNSAADRPGGSLTGRGGAHSNATEQHGFFMPFATGALPPCLR